MNKCVFDYRATPKLDTAWLEAVDESMPDKGFSGWMFNMYPAAATIEHPRYDLQLQGCVLPQGVERIKPVSAQNAGQTTGGNDGGDSESPAGGGRAPAENTGSAPVDRSGATDGSTPAIVRQPGQEDPYYVPGVDGDSAAGAPQGGQQNSTQAGGSGGGSASGSSGQEAAAEARPVGQPAEPVSDAPVRAPADQQELQNLMDQ